MQFRFGKDCLNLTNFEFGFELCDKPTGKWVWW